MRRTNKVNTSDPTQAIHADIERERSNYLPEDEHVTDYRDYVNGKKLPQLTEDQSRILKGLIGKKAPENLARKVVSEARDRLRFLGWRSENAAVHEFLSNVYTLNKLKERQGKIHFDALRDGNHAVAVSWNNDKQRVEIFKEKWWDGKEGIFIAYGPADEPVYAVKDWIVEVEGQKGGDAIRRVIYWPDRIERYVSYDGGASFERFMLEEDRDPETLEAVWPIPWERLDGTPLGIPYVHFRNSGKGEDTYGSSELAGGVLELIDQVNDTHLVMSGAARVAGFPVVTATGVQLAPDPNDPDKVVQPEIAPGSLLYTPNPNAKFGQITAGDFEGISKVRHEKLNALSVSTATPLHSITGGDWPSGEALLRAEKPAEGKATTQKDTFENAWAEVGHKATELSNRFGSGPALDESIETARIESVFSPVERRDALSMSTIVNNLGDAISTQEKLRLMGYTDEQIKKIMAEKEAQADKDLERANLAFSRGVGAENNEEPGRGSETGEEDEEDEEE
jgi:hypothetical protein